MKDVLKNFCQLVCAALSLLCDSAAHRLADWGEKLMQITEWE